MPAHPASPCPLPSQNNRTLSPSANSPPRPNLVFVPNQFEVVFWVRGREGSSNPSPKLETRGPPPSSSSSLSRDVRFFFWFVFPFFCVVFLFFSFSFVFPRWVGGGGGVREGCCVVFGREREKGETQTHRRHPLVLLPSPSGTFALNFHVGRQTWLATPATTTICGLTASPRQSDVSTPSSCPSSSFTSRTDGGGNVVLSAHSSTLYYTLQGLENQFGLGKDVFDSLKTK